MKYISEQTQQRVRLLVQYELQFSFALNCKVLKGRSVLHYTTLHILASTSSLNCYSVLSTIAQVLRKMSLKILAS